MRGIFTRHGPLRTAAVVVATALAMATVIIAESRADPSPEARASRVSGALSISDSRADRAILTGRRMLPGDVVSGTVRITNAGSEAGLFELTAAGLMDSPGNAGGVLSNELRLMIEDVTAQQVVYDGPLGDLDVMPVGEILSGGERSFRFTVSRPLDSSQADYRGATAEVDFDWTATREQKGHCANRILGSGGPDSLSGSRRSDLISGGAGDDHITGLAGQDCIYGEEGDDVIDSRDGESDYVDCGPGLDTVLADPQDVTVGCERPARQA